MSQTARTISFTRYLYIKSDVCIALLSCILNKKTDQAQFWLMELYHSGYYQHTVNLLWRTYYEFYATLNPTFEAHFMKKMYTERNTERNKTEEEKMLLSNMMKNLMIRPYNCDVFMLREIAANLSLEEDSDSESIWDLLQESNYQEIAIRIMDGDEKEVYSVAIDYFLEKKVIKNTKNKKASLLKESEHTANMFQLDKKVIIIVRIMQYYSILHKDQLKMGKNLYLNAKVEDTVLSELGETLSPEKMFSNLVVYNPNEDDYLFLFYGIPTKEEDKELETAYRMNWLYHSFACPIWRERMEEYSGSVNEKEMKIVFQDLDKEEEFWDKYAYNPDEQHKEVKEKNIPLMKKKMTWVSFHEKHKNKGNSLYTPDPDMVEALDEVQCGGAGL